MRPWPRRSSEETSRDGPRRGRSVETGRGDGRGYSEEDTRASQVHVFASDGRLADADNPRPLWAALAALDRANLLEQTTVVAAPLRPDEHVGATARGAFRVRDPALAHLASAAPPPPPAFTVTDDGRKIDEDGFLVE